MTPCCPIFPVYIVIGHQGRLSRASPRPTTAEGAGSASAFIRALLPGFPGRAEANSLPPRPEPPA